MRKKPRISARETGQEALSWIDRHRNQIVELTQQLIRTHSDNPPGNESEVANLIAEKLRSYDVDDVRIVEKSVGRSNVFARLTGSTPKPLLILNTHIDTRPVTEGELERWIVDPYSGQIRDGQMYGKGACDTKASVAAMTMTMACIKESGSALGGELLLLLTADEEDAGTDGMEWLVTEHGLRADAAIVAEPTGIDRSFEYLDTAARGLYSFELEVRGTQMHSSLSDIKNAVNASVKLGSVIACMQERLKLTRAKHRLYPHGNTVVPGVLISGGSAYGTVSGLAVAGTDIRVVPGTSKQGVERDVNRFLRQLRQEDPDLRITQKLKTWVEPAEISQDEDIVRSCIYAYQSVFGHPPKIGGFPGASDARFLNNQARFPSIPAFGPGLLHLAHGPNERVPVEDVIRDTKVYALAALDFLRGEETGSRRGNARTPR